jgi:hypothetical protein
VRVVTRKISMRCVDRVISRKRLISGKRRPGPALECHVMVALPDEPAHRLQVEALGEGPAQALTVGVKDAPQEIESTKAARDVLAHLDQDRIVVPGPAHVAQDLEVKLMRVLLVSGRQAVVSMIVWVGPGGAWNRMAGAQVATIGGGIVASIVGGSLSVLGKKTCQSKI